MRFLLLTEWTDPGAGNPRTESPVLINVDHIKTIEPWKGDETAALISLGEHSGGIDYRRVVESFDAVLAMLREMHS